MNESASKAPVQGMHGVIREYACLAPSRDAVPLPPILDEPLTDISIALGAEGAYYLTGSEVDESGPMYSKRVRVWRSDNLSNWEVVRTLDLEKEVQSPEIHFLRDSYWLTVDEEGMGTALLGFETTDVAKSDFLRAQITEDGDSPSLFLDDDDVFYWVMGGGDIARMKSDPMSGLDEPIRCVLNPEDSPTRRSGRRRGAFLCKIEGYYHLLVCDRKLRHNQIGRTGLIGGTDDVFAAATRSLEDGFEKQYLAFPCAGQTTLFRDKQGELHATYSCTDERGTFRLRPGVFKIEVKDASEPTWSTGFDFQRKDDPELYAPQGFLLRPDTAFTYERGVGSLKPMPMEQAPSTHRDFPWIRDTSIILGHDGNYYMTGTSGDMDSIHLWRSADLVSWEYFKTAFTLRDDDPDLWYNRDMSRLLWAPEIHYFKGTYWLAWCANRRHGMGLLKSESGEPQGPYIPAYEGNRPFMERQIDASIFGDDDGSVYFIWQGRFLRKMNDAMDGFDGETIELKTVDDEQVGYEGIFMARVGPWYMVLAAEWNGGQNRTCGTYDMMYSVSKDLEGPYSPRRVGVPHGGHSTMFKDREGHWQLGIFGNDRSAPFRARPGIVPLRIQDTGDDLLVEPDMI